ncbi:MAG: hypothetical protein DMF93_01580, partial [Acidobacteria bacterium]
MRLYPPRFRRDVGLALVDALEDRMRARRAAGASSFGVRMPAIVDTIRNAAAEWPESAGSRQSPDERAKGRTVVDKLLQDVRYALRLWRRRPGFALVAILTLALGIGANTAMFTIVHAVLLRPLPYDRTERLASVWGRTAAYPRGLISYREYRELRTQSGTFDAIGLYFGQSVNLTGVDEPQRLVGSFVTGSFFDTLGLTAERGRLFTEEDSAPGTVKPVVVITHQTWQRRFNGDDDAIGRTMTLNGTPVTIIGVMAPPFDPRVVPDAGYFISADLFLPVALFPAPGGLDAAGPVMLAIARLAPGISIGRATADLDVIRRRLLADDPQPQADRTLVAESAQETVSGASRPALLLLFAAVGVVLLIACVNVSQLLLARAVDREREIALRAALGASRGTVARQLTVEAALLAFASAAAGLLVGRGALAGLAFLRPPSNVPIPADLPLNAAVLVFSGGVAVVVATLCALVPALKTARPDLRAPLGFDPSNVFTLQFRLPPTKYPTPDDIARFFRAAIERVRAVPGVESAALVRAVPLSGNGGTIGYAIEGRPVDPASLPQARFHLVTPDYFRTMRIQLLRGRDFTDRDDLQAPLVAVINETFARREFPGEDPIGRRLTTPQTPTPITIVGIVADAKHYAPTEPAAAQLYAAHYQVPLIFSSLVARTRGPALSVANDVRKAIWSVDKDQPVWSVAPLDDIVARSHGSTRFLASLLAIFSGVALALAASGIYGVMSYSVTERTHEIGIRLALGASSGRVLREVVGRGLALTAIALMIGLAGAAGLGRLARGVLFGVTPGDPATLAGAAGLLALVSLAACYIPARRAARVDPVV